MRPVTIIKAVRDFLGLLLTSTGSMLALITILLLVAHIATRTSDPDAPIAWGPLVIGLGISSTIMLSGGVLLVRVARNERDE